MIDKEKQAAAEKEIEKQGGEKVKDKLWDLTKEVEKEKGKDK